jgi:2-polyprenyl-3-methyl-5-hydroxy-6-metoxy-1,4-benzoquinol methylase
MKPSDLYDSRYSAGFENELGNEEQILFGLVSQLPRGKLLDVGCGVGNIGAKLGELGFQVTGIDHSAKAVNLARERGLEAEVCDLDSEKLTYGDETFDVVWAGDVIEHVFDPINLLKQLNRVLKKGGCLCLSVPNEFQLRTRLALLIKGRSCQSFTYKTQLIDHHHTHFSLDLLEFMLAESALKIIWFGGLLRWPMHALKAERPSRSRYLSRNFGRAFVVMARKD